MALIVGTNGDDTLTSGSWGDTLRGGLGNDVYRINDVGDVVIENAGEGIDEVQVAYTGAYTLSSNIENATVITVGGVSLTGNALNNRLTGGSSSDTLIGGLGADTLNGGYGIDLVSYAQSSAAIIIDMNLATQRGGDAQGDVLSNIEIIDGSAHADTFIAGSMDTTFNGGAGNDLYIVSNPYSVFEKAGEGLDEVRYNGTAYAQIQLAANAEILADITANGNYLFGNDGNNTLRGGAGNDTLVGRGGADYLDGGDGYDVVVYEFFPTTGGAQGVLLDFTTGVHGGNTLAGATGDVFVNIEEFRGSDYGDTIIGSATAQFLNGGNHYNSADTLSYRHSSAVTIDLRNMTVSGGHATGDTFTGFEIFEGSAFADTIYGGTGTYSNGNTWRYGLIGGAGDDVYIVEPGTPGYSSFHVMTELVNGGRDEVRLTGQMSLYLQDNFEVLTDISAFGNALQGNSGNNTISGGAGNDTLIGLGGADHLDGGDGYDVIYYHIFQTSTPVQGVLLDFATGVHGGNTLGGANGDTFANIEEFRGSEHGDTIIGGAAAQFLNGGDHYNSADTLSYRHSSAVTIDLRNMTVSGGHATGDTFTGFEIFEGSAFADTIYGGTGTYMSGSANRYGLIGGAGDDVYIIDPGPSVSHTFHVMTELANGGRDEVRLTGQMTIALQANFELLTDVSSFGNELIGNIGANTISGGAGDDTITGAAGADYIDGGSGYDIVRLDFDGLGVGTAISINLATGVHSGNAALGDVYVNVEQFNAGNYDDTMIGGAGAEVFLGSYGWDSLDGGGGNDRLDGGYGNDRLRGGTGADVFVFAEYNGTDTISDFSVSGGDVIRLGRNMNGNGISDAATLLATALYDAGPDTVIILGRENFITLTGVLRSQLSVDDFQFV